MKSHLSSSSCGSEALLSGLFILLAFLEECLWDFDYLYATKVRIQLMFLILSGKF